MPVPNNIPQGGTTVPTQTPALTWYQRLAQTLTGRPGETTILPKFTPEQEQFRQRLLGQAGNQLQNPQQQFNAQPGIQQLMQLLTGQLGQQGRPTDTSGFNPIEAHATRQFNTQTIPGLAERFQAMGGQGTGNSSAFQGALGQAGSDLQSGLASLRSQYGIQQQGLNQRQQGLNQGLLGQLLGTQGQQQGLNQNLLLNILQQGLQSPFESIYSPPTTGLLGGAASGFGGGLSRLFGG